MYGFDPRTNVDELAAPLMSAEAILGAAEARERPPLKVVGSDSRERRFGRLSLFEIGKRVVRGPDYVIDDWLVAREQSFLAGESQSGKSFLAMHAALCIATGQAFFGRPVQQGLVIYQAGESGSGVVDQRIPAWLKKYGEGIDPDAPFEILPHKIDLFNAEKNDTQELIDAIRAICMERANVPLRAVFIDTLAKAMRGGDEISGKDIGRVLSNVERLSVETGAHVCVLHHLPKGGGSLRGHGSLKGDVDCVAFVHRDEKSGVRTVVFDKVKDGPTGNNLQFALESTVIGERVDGKKITSCVCVPLGEREVAERREAVKGFQLMTQKGEPAIFAAFWKAMETKGVFSTPEQEAEMRLPPGTILVHYNDWRDAYISGLAEGNEQSSTPEAIRKVWERKAGGLLKYGILGYSRPFMWWTGKPVRGYSRQPDMNRTDDVPPPADGFDDVEF